VPPVPAAEAPRSKWERPARSPEEVEADSARRAKGEIRRWVRANRLTHLWTLTNADEVYDWEELERRKERFMERMAADGWHLPIALVAEPHPEGHGWHIHFAAPVFIRASRVRAWWPYGRVDVRGPKGRQKGAWRGRNLASYLGKYVGKAIGAEELAGCTPRPAGAHRWWKTRGHEPVPMRYSFASLRECLAWIRRHWGRWDVILPFGQDDPCKPEGFWLSFPDSCIRGPPAQSLV
jgi:hypothetical protein